MMIIPLFIGFFSPSQVVVWDFRHQRRRVVPLNQDSPGFIAWLVATYQAEASDVEIILGPTQSGPKHSSDGGC